MTQPTKEKLKYYYHQLAKFLLTVLAIPVWLIGIPLSLISYYIVYRRVEYQIEISQYKYKKAREKNKDLFDKLVERNDTEETLPVKSEIRPNPLFYDKKSGKAPKFGSISDEEAKKRGWLKDDGSVK